MHMKNDKQNGMDKLIITKEQQLTLIPKDKSLFRIGFLDICHWTIHQIYFQFGWTLMLKG
jgi:hypothetical protein